ncbi:hypothetical protein Syun_003653 [Stephania yunnanensis]|uniref:holo-[acyl-carrier-protein] synthase n=1 Tax=Stephania yunnanensis TaxID=152371 RepID=A0AAP0L1V2_9MAGN
MVHNGGVHRWFFNTAQWNPSEHEFSFLLSVLPQHEQSAITRFLRLDDRKRALISRLLQYGLVHQVLGIPFEDIIINRTLEGKPYLENIVIDSELPNFNFNVSHHGDYVAIASDSIHIVGVDIVSHVIPERETTLEHVQNFSSYFTSLEWGKIMEAEISDEILVELYRYWCLKEAFIKAIGAGLGYDLERLEFHHTNWTDIYCLIDGHKSEEWQFWLSELGEGHWVSVARGHPRFAVKNYWKTLHSAEVEESAYHSNVQMPTNFIPQTIEQLLPVSLRESYRILSNKIT